MKAVQLGDLPGVNPATVAQDADPVAQLEDLLQLVADVDDGDTVVVAALCAVGVLRASGALDFGLDGIRHLVEWAGWDTRFVDALPTAMVKPFSGSAARAMLIETMKTSGVDSFPALVAATIQGSTETTFYVLAVYFGAVGIQRARHAVGCALLAELAGVLGAIGVCYWFFG